MAEDEISGLLQKIDEMTLEEFFSWLRDYAKEDILWKEKASFLNRIAINYSQRGIEKVIKSGGLDEEAKTYFDKSVNSARTIRSIAKKAGAEDAAVEAEKMIKGLEDFAKEPYKEKREEADKWLYL